VALVEGHPPGRFDHRTTPRAGGFIGVQGTPVSSLPDEDLLRREWDRFDASRGGGWRAWLDLRSGLPTLSMGPGIPWSEGGASDLDLLSRKAGEFLRSHPGILGEWGDQVVLDREATVARGTGVRQIRFGQVVGGVPVEGASFDFHVSKGNLVAFGARRWAPVETSPVPSLGPAEARSVLDSYLGAGAGEDLFDLAAPKLLLLPVDPRPFDEGAYVGPRGKGYSHRLVWRFRFTDLEGIATWTGEVDAHEGEVLAFYDDTSYDRIQGHVNPISDDGQCETGGCPEPDYPMPFVDYTEDGGPVQFANQFGLYQCSQPGASIETHLEGRYFRINDSCGAISETTTCDEELDLGAAAGVNCGVGPGASAGNTDGARSAYYSLNLVNRKARFWMPGISWLDTQVECRTNVSSTCNASYGGGVINMYRAGNGCGNTAQIQGVVVHEWGHGMDEFDGGGKDRPGEAYSDVVAIFESRSSCMGRNFYVGTTCDGYGDTCLTCTGIREMDWDARRRHTPATPSDYVAGNCGPGGGACAKQVHCESHVPSETIFDLATRDLPAMGLDPDTAWQLAERLWYQSRPGSGGDIYNCSLPDSDSCSVGTWYHQLRLQDDDDGDLSNGTPHAAAIFAAFDRHDIACGEAGDPENQNTSSCPALDAPAVSATVLSNAVEVGWSAVAGADGYRVYRNENGCDRSQFPVAEVGSAATAYLDDGLANGFPVFYRVQAVGANSACESPVSSCLETAAQSPAGSLAFSRASYGCSHEIVLEVTDSNHAGSTLSVSVWSATETTPETVTLTETTAGSARFSGSIFTTSAAPGPDGLLSVAHGDTLTAEYVDADDGEGGSGVPRQAGASADCIAPAISDVRESGASDIAATIDWSTDKAASSTVVFGDAVPPTTEESLGSLVLEHEVFLTGLSDCTVYHYEVRSADAAGNVASDDSGGAYHHFETYTDLGGGPQPCHQGRVFIEVDPVGCGTSLPLRLGDTDLNADPGTAETAVVAVHSTTEASPETVVLTETGPDTGIFTGSIPTAVGTPVPGDGILQVTSGDLATATYEDADDGTGGPATAIDSASVDCLGPAFLSVQVTDITDSVASLQWTTDVEATGRVDWGTTPALGNEIPVTGLLTGHVVSLGPLEECGRVYFRILSTNELGQTSVADVDGAPFEFNASTVGGTVFRDGFETDTGWTLEGEWEIDEPQGLGTSPGDPTAALTGTRVLGHDLSGQGAWLGDYEPSTNESATSPVIDASGLTSVELLFHRWVNAANGSVAYLEARDGSGVWQQVWASPNFGGITNSSWSSQSFDVSAHAAGNASFQVRFRQSVFTGSAHDAGWNVDSLYLRDGSAPAYAACGGCGGAPTFAGVASATDDDPCGDSGVTLSWLEAPAWGTGAAGTYVVYRDTVPGFMPSTTNRVASGVAGTSWTDPAPPVGVTHYYLVRAENDETCAYGPNNGGLLDGNLVYASAANETEQPPPGEVGATLLVEGVEGTDVRLTWSTALDAARYHVYRSVAPDSGFGQIGQPTLTLFDDEGAYGDPEDWHYLVVAADACGNEGP
jgi:hypothetical protein